VQVVPGVAISLCSMDDRPHWTTSNRYLNRKMEVFGYRRYGVKKTYTPSENKGGRSVVALMAVVSQGRVVTEGAIRATWKCSPRSFRQQQKYRSTRVTIAAMLVSRVSALVASLIAAHRGPSRSGWQPGVPRCRIRSWSSAAAKVALIWQSWSYAK
jgi:hypothetical protein